MGQFFLPGTGYTPPNVEKMVHTGGTHVLSAAQNKSTGFEVSGVLTSDQIIVTADTMAPFTAENLTTGAFSLTFKTAAGAGVSIPQTVPPTTKLLYANGVDVDTITSSSAGREVLLSARTYYVATTGNDTNNGLTAATPFLTGQHACDIAAMLDTSIYDVTIQFADGTYTGNILIKNPVGSGKVMLNGNMALPGNVVLTCSTGRAIRIASPVIAQVTGLTLTGSGTADIALLSENTGSIYFNNIVFGTGFSFAHCYSGSASFIAAIGSYSITGASSYHLYSSGGLIATQSLTLTLVGIPAFLGAFVSAPNAGASILMANEIFVGAATGVRYIISSGGAVNTGGGGALFIPGSVAGVGGTTVGGGFYV